MQEQMNRLRRRPPKLGQSKQIIKRFEREAKKKYKKMEKAGVKVVCLCSKPKWHLVMFDIEEIRKIIRHGAEDEKGVKTIDEIIKESFDEMESMMKTQLNKIRKSMR